MLIFLVCKVSETHSAAESAPLSKTTERDRREGRDQVEITGRDGEDNSLS